MNADEKLSKRRDIVIEAVQSGCVEECLHALDKLDMAAQGKRNAYYDFPPIVRTFVSKP